MPDKLVATLAGGLAGRRIGMGKQSSWHAASPLCLGVPRCRQAAPAVSRPAMWPGPRPAQSACLLHLAARHTAGQTQQGFGLVLPGPHQFPLAPTSCPPPPPPGVTASVAVYPMETARTRMALGTAHGHFLGAVAHIAGREGVGALFRVGRASAWAGWCGLCQARQALGAGLHLVQPFTTSSAPRAAVVVLSNTG